MLLSGTEFGVWPAAKRIGRFRRTRSSTGHDLFGSGLVVGGARGAE